MGLRSRLVSQILRQGLQTIDDLAANRSSIVSMISPLQGGVVLRW